MAGNIDNVAAAHQPSAGAMRIATGELKKEHGDEKRRLQEAFATEIKKLAWAIQNENKGTNDTPTRARLKLAKESLESDHDPRMRTFTAKQDSRLQQRAMEIHNVANRGVSEPAVPEQYAEKSGVIRKTACCIGLLLASGLLAWMVSNTQWSYGSSAYYTTMGMIKWWLRIE